MAHDGTLGTYRFPSDADDIRGASVYGSNDEELGKVADVIFDHDTMDIKYLVVDSGGWLPSGKFLFPADRVVSDTNRKDDLSIDATKKQIEDSPSYDENWLTSKDDRKKYEEEFKKYWHEAPVMHRRGSDRIITPPEEPPAPLDASNESLSVPERTAADLFPERLTDKFPDPRPGAHKVTLRPQGTIRRAEEAAQGVTLLKPRWETFGESLLRNLESIQANCSQCGSAREKKIDAA
ncbi:MAG: PRC-barrel protein [Acidobacteriaceae bacterium]|jgi:sporulation protein YlmC with PRC-barrel domain|nr:PRC-barrel protein [Acidobacteriaceae bacterium]